MSDDNERQSYRVIRGLTFLGKRAEPGEVRDDIPEQSVPWLLKRGAIKRVKATKQEAGK